MRMFNQKFPDKQLNCLTTAQQNYSILLRHVTTSLQLEAQPRKSEISPDSTATSSSANSSDGLLSGKKTGKEHQFQPGPQTPDLKLILVSELDSSKNLLQNEISLWVQGIHPYMNINSCEEFSCVCEQLPTTARQSHNHLPLECGLL